MTYFLSGLVLIGREKDDTYEGIPVIPESGMSEWTYLGLRLHPFVPAIFLLAGECDYGQLQDHACGLR